MTYSPIPSQGPRLWAVSLTRPPSRPKVSRLATGVLPLASPKGVLWMTYSPIPSQGPRLWAVSLTRPPSRPKVSRLAAGVLPLASPKEWGGQETRPTTNAPHNKRAPQQAKPAGAQNPLAHAVNAPVDWSMVETVNSLSVPQGFNYHVQVGS